MKDSIITVQNDRVTSVFGNNQIKFTHFKVYSYRNSTILLYTIIIILNHCAPLPPKKNINKEINKCISLSKKKNHNNIFIQKLNDVTTIIFHFQKKNIMIHFKQIINKVVNPLVKKYFH